MIRISRLQCALNWHAALGESSGVSENWAMLNIKFRFLTCHNYVSSKRYSRCSSRDNICIWSLQFFIIPKDFLMRRIKTCYLKDQLKQTGPSTQWVIVNTSVHQLRHCTAVPFISSFLCVSFLCVSIFARTEHEQSPRYWPNSDTP